jgi:hypothetical protein
MSYKQFITQFEDDILLGEVVRRYFLFFILQGFFFAPYNNYEAFSSVHLQVKYIFLSFVFPLLLDHHLHVLFKFVVRPSIYNYEEYTYFTYC